VTLSAAAENSADDYVKRGLAEAGDAKLDEAIADYSAAIELDPKLVAAYYNRGNAKMEKDDQQGAIADFNVALKLDPGYRAAQLDRGLARTKMRNWAGALVDFQRCFPLTKGGTDYPHLFTWLIHARLGQTEVANDELSAYLTTRGNLPPNDWYFKVAGHLLGSVTETDLLAAATSADAKRDRSQHCEAWFYAGMKRLLSGDRKTAADYFQKCVETGEKDFLEYYFAQSELKALEKAPNAEEMRQP